MIFDSHHKQNLPPWKFNCQTARTMIPYLGRYYNISEPLVKAEWLLVHQATLLLVDVESQMKGSST